ncbi:universal stress protein [Fodinibius sediminis]|uniref:Nucleotide-binding universal stress protein, UspA family n=1 Tax=Fodinibius sediminis TaxID=1214077 RepID=A0A521CVI8_9BACT|nr:universal stress protein [Fodinibius sediminis]SMO63438.1 Nucleotide-binding universal stress protein, UspA family [Fodinibius sediminis]
MALSFDHILFPTDFSNNADRALPFAAEIALRSGAQLTLFHSGTAAMDMSPGFQKAKDKEIHDADEAFEKLIGVLRRDDRYKEISIRTLLQSGNTLNNILSYLKEHKPDLIVMGTQGATGDRNILYGSITTSIIQKSEVPVLAVPYGSTFDQFKNIVFATDFKESDLAALEQTIQWAELFDSAIDVFHVAERQNLEAEIRFRGFRELVQSQTTYKNINFHLRYEYDFFPAAAEYIIDHPASLIVMCRYKKTFWEAFGERNHSKEMGFYSKIPLLVLIGKKEVDYAFKFEEGVQV